MRRARRPGTSPTWVGGTKAASRRAAASMLGRCAAKAVDDPNNSSSNGCPPTPRITPPLPRQRHHPTVTGSVGDPVEVIEQRTGRRGSQHRPVIPDPRPHRALADTLVLAKRGSHPRRRPAGAPPMPGRSRPPALLHAGHIHHPRRTWGQHKILNHRPVLPPTLQQLTFQQQRRPGPLVGQHQLTHHRRPGPLRGTDPGPHPGIKAPHPPHRRPHRKHRHPTGIDPTPDMNLRNHHHHHHRHHLVLFLLRVSALIRVTVDPRRISAILS